MTGRDHNYFVYIVASRSGTLYIGVTNNLLRRISEHKSGKFEGFAHKYSCNKLVYYERYQYIQDAISREKKIKKWNRKKKEDLIRSINPRWHDLYEQIL